MSLVQSCRPSCGLLPSISGVLAWWSLNGDVASLYADDIALVLVDVSQIPAAIAAIQFCKCFTGLELNLLKTEAFSPSIGQDLNIASIKVLSHPVKYLGAWLGTDTEELNFPSVLMKLKCQMRYWQSRPLTLKARVLVFKTMIFSICTHMLITTFISNKHLDSLQRIANEFLWCGKNKVSQNICCNSSAWGGLTNLHVQHFVHSLRLKWMVHLWQDKGTTWSCLAWPQVLSVFPEVTIPGLRHCSEGLLNKLSAFNAAMVRSFALVNGYNAWVERQNNIWFTPEYPGVSYPMVVAGYVEISDLPLVNDVIDFQAVRTKLLDMGYQWDFL